MPSSPQRLALVTLAVALLLCGIFAAVVVPFGANLRGRIKQAIVERDAAVLHPVALQQLADQEAVPRTPALNAAALTATTLRNSRQSGMLAVIIFDADGERLQAVPDNLILPELAPSDYLRLLENTPISRLHPHFPLDRHFQDIRLRDREAPVLEVLLPLHGGGDAARLLGFAQYYIDARGLVHELEAVDARIQNQIMLTLGVGWSLIALLGTGTYFGLRRAHRQIAERSERLARANLELTLATKTSALGQITSHLIHGLQGPVAGLRAVVAAQAGKSEQSEWQSAVNYTAQLERLVHEAVTLLSDVRASASYDLTGDDLAASLRERFVHTPGVTFTAEASVTIDNHRGSVLCLIAANLIQNAVEAAATQVEVKIVATGTSTAPAVEVAVSDNGPGIADHLRTRLFEPGASGRTGGSGLGLAISRLLARQIDATLELAATSPTGTRFLLTIPRATAVPS